MSLREKLAALAHDQWSGWMEYLFSKTDKFEIEGRAAGVVIPNWAVERWRRQMKTPYAELPEEEKESDRKEADRVLSLMNEPPEHPEGKPGHCGRLEGLYKEDLDLLANHGCQCKDCREAGRDKVFFFHARCHPEAGTWVSHQGGTLTVICRECRKLVAEVAVARRPS
jgi:hypothetical protein